jgi:collagen type I alpha
MSTRLSRSARSAHRELRREEGQSVIFVTIALLVLLGFVGLVLDVGQLYVAQRHLQTATDAAALAAAQDLPNGTTALATVCTYSATKAGGNCPATNNSGGYISNTGVNGENYNGSLGDVSTQATLECLSYTSAGTNCLTGTGCTTSLPPANQVGCNAIKVTATTTVKPWIMQILGIGSTTVKTSSTASLAGGNGKPLDIEVAIDRTVSMNSNCTATVHGLSNPDDLDCAKLGMRELLEELEPCTTTTPTCGSRITGTHDVADPLDRVGLMAFPAEASPTSTQNYTLPNETDCYTDVGGSNLTLSTTSGADGDYQMVPLSSDYKLTDTTGTDESVLNKYSDLVGSVYWGRCPGGVAPSGSGAGSSIALGGSTVATNNTGIGGGPSSAVNVGSAATGVGGGVNSGSTGDYYVDKTTGTASSLNLHLPTNAATGDFLLATITGQVAGLTASSSICAPTSAWTLVKQTVSNGGSGTPVIQATYSGSVLTTGGVGFPPYTFTFHSGDCSSGSLSLYATGVVVRYTDVSGIDAGAVGDASGNASTASFSGGAPSTTWPGTTTFTGPATTSRNWNTTELYVEVSDVSTCGNGYNQTYTKCDTAITSSGTISSIAFNLDASAGTGRTFTVTLEKNGSDTTLYCTFSNASTGCSQTGSVAVNAGDTVALAVQETSGSGHATGSATASATEAGTAGQYVSLASSCVNQSATACNDANVASAGTLTSAGLTFSSNVPSGDTFNVALYRNGAASGSSCNITGSGSNRTSCTWTPNLAVAANDKLELFVTRTNGTAALTGASATTSASGIGGGTALTAPSVTTSATGDLVVRIYGTGTTSYASGGTPKLVIAGSSTATGVDDAAQAAAGATGTASATSGAAANWAAQTVALKFSQQSYLSIPAPAAAATGDFLLATVTAHGLGTTGAICAPAGWTQVGSISTSGTGSTSISEATFYKTYGSSDTTPYTFTFASACPSGTALTAAATGIIVRYTGVSMASPIDGTPTAANTGANGTSASPITAPAYTTTVGNDQVVRIYGTGAAGFAAGAAPTVSMSGGNSSSGISSATQAGAGSTGTASVQSSTAANWSARTVALESSGSLTINRPGTPASGDLIVVTVTARSTSSSGSGYICAPNSNWTYIPQSSATPTAEPTSGAGTSQITHATFWSVRGTTVAESYTFSFQNVPCGTSSPTSVADNATAVAVDYTGADEINAIDFNNESTSSTTYDTGESKTTPGSGTSLSSPTIQTNYFNDEIVHTFGTAGTSLSLGSKGVQSETSSTSSTGFSDEGAAGAPGTGKGSYRTATGGSGAWVGESFAIIADEPGCLSGGASQSGACSYGVEAPTDWTTMKNNTSNGVGSGETYYALAMSEAQNALTAHGQSGSQKVIVLLSDGDANIDGPDACKQAIYNAEQAEAAGTWVIAIAYESSNSSSSSCETDNPSHTYSGQKGSLAISALCTMQLIADNPVTKPTDSHFSSLPSTPTSYTNTSVYSSMENYCSSNPSSDTNVTGSRFYRVTSDAQLADVFQQIGNSLSTERLVSNNAA